ncbi:uncharacterized protein LOC123691097 isoform X2 [Colias croceus]|uniref:uncharacterized protein LOC123691097 isoform X2 n=1 Tax=Colias crocea TaxID=72248 RepID=UPI001E280A84|nr:uncharacterized protein LOC123691097 isoform X2 [Colias croceus]
MDDDYKDYRKNKPQQKLYKPGSGPLRRSKYGSDARMESYDIDEGLKGRNRSHYGSVNSVNGDTEVYKEQMVSNRFRKPEQQLYQARSGDSYYENDRPPKTQTRSDHSSHYKRPMSGKQDNHGGNAGSYHTNSRKDPQIKGGMSNDINFNRQFNQESISRSSSPAKSVHGMNSLERNRDSRSMETWAGRYKSNSGGKPPLGRRNSAGFSGEPRHKHVVNLDNIPPRFRKKYLEQSGHHSIESIDQFNRGPHNDLSQSSYSSGQTQSSCWSQTLPSRGRGRLREHEHFDREKFINSYLKNYDVHNSHRSTPSSSYTNLYEPHEMENRNIHNQIENHQSNNEVYENVSKNGMNNYVNDADKDVSKTESENSKDTETFPTSLSDMTNLDWTEEVEKNIKLDEISETSTSFSQSVKPLQEVKKTESKDPKRRSRRRDRRSSSRGQKNSEKKDHNRKDSNVSIQNEPERNRKDSNASIQYDMNLSGLKQRERERRDSHRSNRSSTIGNSRDDLDRWRSLRSYSREQSTERRIVSQCNSRDTSVNRALSPRDSEGFRVPSMAPKSGNWSATNQKRNESSWASGRQSSAERRRHSPAPSVASIDPASESVDAGSSATGSGRRSRKRAGRRRGRNAENVQPSPHPPGSTPAPTNINWREEILEAKKHQPHDRPQENSHQRNRLNSVLSDKSVSDVSSSQPGLLVLPHGSSTSSHKDQVRGGINGHQKTLYDHHNPSKPIIVQTNSTKPDMRMDRGVKETSRNGLGYEVCEAGEAARAARHVALLQQVERADAILKTHTVRGPLALAANWQDVTETRKFLQSALQRLLMSDLKFCQADNIEQQFWKILYYHFIETLRKSITQVTPEQKVEIVKLINTIIDEGVIFFENLIQMLEKTYKFNTEDYLNENHALPPKGLGYVGLAMVSVQKLYVFLGDLARYKEQVNETNNYAKSKFWYTKAQQVNPKNGRPYNQLAILAIYARRKLDAVYYYMRSLMSSNPFQSARESLLSLFEENRKKYEAAERKRRAVAESKGAESSGAECAGEGGAARRELWVRPGAARTAHTHPHRMDQHDFDAMTPVELNKTFITAYLHVHGKLITKIGMETFEESATQMLGQFRALLHRQPLPTPAARLLQLTALNMFAVETNAAYLKGSETGERTAWLECALGVSLLMFGALLERCCALLPEPAHSQHHTDALSLLPAIKVWSDWMLCHSSVWNPPPSLDNFGTENENDPWSWLAKLMNILESMDDKSIELESEAKDGYICVRLAEDASLAGFTPLMYMEPAVAWARAEPPLPHHAAEHALRTRKLLFFGTEYLVGVEPPVLKLEYPTDAQPRYVSAVQQIQPNYTQLQHLTEDSEDEDSTSGATSGPTSHSEGVDVEGTDEVTRRLLRRKEQLESRKATLEKRRQRMQEMLGSGSVCVELEVRPRWLVPDTNCFIDHLPLLRALVAPAQTYQIAVPLVVMTELEGLCKCSRLGSAARAALAWASGAGGGAGGGAGSGAGGVQRARGVRLVTTRGSVLTSRTFTAEDHRPGHSNDDRVLDTAINLQANVSSEQDTKEEKVATVRARRVCEVVLLTDDRNLRVKALAADLPARDLPSFALWAGVTCDNHKKAESSSVANTAGDAK